MPRMPLPVKLLRRRTLPEAGGQTLFFVTEGGDRRHPDRFFSPDQVPEFEGESAWFEVDKHRGRWTFLRQIDPPSG